MLLEAKASVRHQHPIVEYKNTRITESLGSTQFAAVLHHSKLVRVCKRDFVSL